MGTVDDGTFIHDIVPRHVETICHGIAAQNRDLLITFGRINLWRLSFCCQMGL